MKINELVSKVLSFATSHKEGYTLNIRTLEPVKTGYVVSYKETQDSYNAVDVLYVIAHALKHDNIVGGWYNEKNNKYYFDSNKVFAVNELDEAIDFGLKNGQKSIFDLDNNKTIWLDNQAYKVKKFSFSSFADWMLNVVTETVKHYKGDVLIDSYKIISLRNEQLFGSQSVEPQSFSFYWAVRDTGTWLYHVGGDNLFSINELLNGLGAKNIYLITFKYDSAKNETITVREVDKSLM